MNKFYSLAAHRSTAVTGRLVAQPLGPRASTALASPAGCWGSDMGFLCNNGGSLQLAQWVQMENRHHLILGMPLIPQGENVVQVSVKNFVFSYNIIICIGSVENTSS